MGIEFAAAGLGAGVLGALGRADYIPVWICAVVGVHFVPLTRVLRDARLVALGVCVTAVAVAALVAGLTRTQTPSAVTGLGTGVLLLAMAIVDVVYAVRYAV